MAHLKAFGRLFLAYTRELVHTRRPPNHEAFLQVTYRTLLHRPPDGDGLQFYLDLLQNHRVTRRDVVRSILDSVEFHQTAAYDLGTIEAVHQARKLVFQQLIPPAQTVVDLGGAAHDYPEGALLFLGYPHRPHDLYIVDLPPEARLGGAEHAEQTSEVVTYDGVRIHYLYASMTERLPLADNSVDLVVSGESIEHIAEIEADIVCQEAYRVLRPGAAFCLDTPNAALTRLQSPDKLIHPEHQKEYTVAELEAKLRRWNFEIVDRRGITPMPESLAHNRFDYGEMIRNIRLSERPEEGYMFYLQAVKPE